MRRALRAIVADADILEVDNEWWKMRFLVAVITDETIDALGAFEAEHENCEVDDELDATHLDKREEDDPTEDNDEDCCQALEDGLGTNVSDGGAGDPVDGHPEGGHTGFNPWKWGKRPDDQYDWVWGGYDQTRQEK